MINEAWFPNLNPMQYFQ